MTKAECAVTRSKKYSVQYERYLTSNVEHRGQIPYQRRHIMLKPSDLRSLWSGPGDRVPSPPVIHLTTVRASAEER